MKHFLATACLSLSLPILAHASYLDDYGLPELRALYPTLTGSGVKVAIAEVDYDGVGGAPLVFHANPNLNTGAAFSFFDSGNPFLVSSPNNGSATYNPSQLSGHANYVASMLLNNNPANGTLGVATGITQAKIFEADYFISNILTSSVNIGVDIVHQSYAVESNSFSLETYYYYTYVMDSRVNQSGTLFVNAAPNGLTTADPVLNIPGGMYNGITTGISSGNHKGQVHVVTNVGQTSESAPLVTGVSAILIDAGRKGLTGAKNQSSSDKEDSRVIKSAIMTGADKFHPWNPTSTKPLDATYGAGTLNASKALQALTGGQMTVTLTNNQANGATSNNPTIGGAGRSIASGWDLASLTTSGNQERVAHYLLDFSTFADAFTFAATLTWNSLTESLNAYTAKSINNFDLALVDYTTKSLVWRSSSADQNVEHIYLESLSKGIYDLQVILKNAGETSFTDTYAISYLTSPMMAIPEPSGALLVILSGAGLLFRRRRK